MSPKAKQMRRSDAALTAGAILGLCLISFGCTRTADRDQGSANREAPPNTAERRKAEPRSEESRSMDPKVQMELERMEAEKRATLLKDAQAALDETRNALASLDRGDKTAALAALERAGGKLDLVVSRDPGLALAPVGVTTSMVDLYTTPETVKTVVQQAKDDLAREEVQHARLLVQDLASEADIHVTEIPLATYPAAIKAVAPLIDAGKLDEAKAALQAALNTLVIETYVVPLPPIRAEAMLAASDALAGKKERTPEDKTKLLGFIQGARRELQLAEALGYGDKNDYQPLYSQLDDIQKRIESGQSGRGLLDKLRNSVKSFKFSS